MRIYLVGAEKLPVWVLELEDIITCAPVRETARPYQVGDRVAVAVIAMQEDSGKLSKGSWTRIGGIVRSVWQPPEDHLGILVVGFERAPMDSSKFLRVLPGNWDVYSVYGSPQVVLERDVL